MGFQPVRIFEEIGILRPPPRPLPARPAGEGGRRPESPRGSNRPLRPRPAGEADRWLGATLFSRSPERLHRVFLQGLHGIPCPLRVAFFRTVPSLDLLHLPDEPAGVVDGGL